MDGISERGRCCAWAAPSTANGTGLSELGIPWAVDWPSCRAVSAATRPGEVMVPIRPAGLCEGEAEHAHVEGFVQLVGQRQPWLHCRAAAWKVAA